MVKKQEIFSNEEREAMAETVRERKQVNLSKEELEKEVLARINKLPAPERDIALSLHRLVRLNTKLFARTWYGMPAYANEEGVVCFFQPASKFKSRYSTLGFTDRAKLDEGEMWPTSFAINKMNEKVQKEVAELLRRATIG